MPTMRDDLDRPDTHLGEGLPPSRRQLEVLRAYVHLGTHERVGKALGISSRTVQSHLAALRMRMGVHNEAQAVYALWLGFRDHLTTCALADHARCLPYRTAE